MPARLKTTTTELGDSRVRVQVEVPAEEVDRQLGSAASALGRDLKIPGFRKGKVPPEVVIKRVGRDAVLEEAVRSGLASWYERALSEAHLATVGDPKVDLGDLPAAGEPLSFSIEVAVRPPAKLGPYKGIEAGRREPHVPEEAIDAELERLRESLASLETVERAASDGDFLVVDFTGTIDGEPFEGGEARGYLLELGSGRLVEGFETQLRGASAGDSRDVRVTFPADYGAADLRGREAVFAVDVKEVKEKRLPELSDDFAVEAGGFDSLEELRGEIASALTKADEQAIDREFREAVVDAAVAQASIHIPDELVHSKAHEMWHMTAHRLRRQGIDPERYLELAGKSEEEVVGEAEGDARRSLGRESLLAAVVEEEGIEVSDDEVLETLRGAATAADGSSPKEEELRKSFERAKAEGRDEVLREDIAMRKAVDLMVEHAKPISLERAAAREKLWTPASLKLPSLKDSE